MSDKTLTMLMLLQIVVSVVLTVLVLLQNRSDGLGSMFGGSGGEVFRTKRGLEKVLYRVTIILGVIFAANSLLIVKYAA
jgi:preprotein translocase subunit SecG